MLVKRDKIIQYLNDYLNINSFEDYCNNGLQIEGKNDVSKVITGVSLSQKLIDKAVSKKADMIIVHHGIFIGDTPSPLVLRGIVKERIKKVLMNDINLAGYHLPLDAHFEIGNNISLCKSFGIKKCEPFDVGFIGQLEEEMGFDEFTNLVDRKLETKSFVLPFGKKKIKKVAIISGGSSPSFEKAKEVGADVFIAGDVREEVVRKIEESEINFINAGHYNTEKFGVQNLGKLIEKKFKVDVEFVDIPCEV
ncbi:MAG: Nif3-like dinuclear metal center hexameric protein [Candidatus Pacebacteria bacterium]|nr:Nif3-like dinuclear metal center hexameric protein [Candidatus Paceibacterota bacterium]